MSDSITSVRNPRIQQAARLRQRESREEQQRFLIDGAREIGRALDAGVELVELFVCEASLREESRPWIRRAEERGAAIHLVSSAVQARLAFGERDEGLVAVARLRQRLLSDILLPERPLVAVLSGVEKPGNLGAILRTADAAGLSAVIVADGGTDLFNPNVIRASLGTVFTLPAAAAPQAEVLAWLQSRRLRIFAARVEASVPYTSVSFQDATALVLGSEASGLSPFWNDPQITPIAVPMRGSADSLNVSVTAGILFYEALRQREARHG